MDAAPYYPPTYFPALYFTSAAISNGNSSPIGHPPYNAPTYFAPAYFYGAPSDVGQSTTNPSPYEAPTYFAPAYFYGAPAPSTGGHSPTKPLPYNAPTYFSPDYFYEPSASVTASIVAPGPMEPPVQDQPSYLILLELIQSTGGFEEVIFGSSSQRSQAGADTYPLAIVTPKGWEESDDFDPVLVVRRVAFSITVVVKSQDDLPRYDQIDGLVTAIKQVVDRSSLNGSCLPALTRIRAARYEYANHYPEQSATLEGEFTSIIDPTANVPATS